MSALNGEALRSVLLGCRHLRTEHLKRGKIWCADDLGSTTRLYYSLTRYVGIEHTVGIGGSRPCCRSDDGTLLEPPLFPGSP